MAAPFSAPDAKGAKPDRRGVLSRLFRWIKPYRGLFATAVSITLAGSILGPLVPYLFQYTLDGPMAEGDANALRFWILVIIGIVLLQAVFNYFSTWVTNLLGQSVMNDLRRDVYRHIMRLRIKYFDHNPIGTLQTRTVSDIQTLNNVFSQGLVTIAGQLLQLFAILGIMLYIDWGLTLVVLAVLPLLLLATWVFKNKVREAFNRVRKFVARLNAFIQEHLTGMLVTQIFNREDEEYRRFKGLNAEHRRAHLDTVLYYSIFFPVVEIISAMALALLVWYGTGEVLEGTLTFGALVSFMLYINMFFRPIRLLADQFNTLQLGIVSADRIFKILDDKAIIPENNEGLASETLQAQPAAIEFDKVCFAYNEDEWVLRDVSFHVPSAKTTAIVGATGAGKSSIINVLMRLYDIQQGEIRLGGYNINAYQLYALRESMGLVLQDVFLFSGTIYENITLFNDEIPRERVIEAAELVGAHRFISQLPGGYNYKVGERGATLSTGQRQLLSFIRILVYDPKVLLLDEATANIDTETEELIQQAIQKVMAGRTAIIIAHRLSTIQSADQILVMHKGKLVERGNHQELLAQNGYYKKLYLLQYGHKVSA